MSPNRRGYTKAFFVTNQYVRDRSRADMEDELREKHSLDVRILDRTWILDKVFGGQHEQLAIDDLKIQTWARTQVKKGPYDLQREQDLEELETRIKTASGERLFGVPFVDDCGEAARLARSLEKPRAEVDGLFQRAERAANEYGSKHQQLVVAYDKAWTAVFWHEDMRLFSDLYTDVEKRTCGSHNAHELELLSNLWHVLYAVVGNGKLDKSVSHLETRTKTLTAELRRLSGEENSPSSALHAKSHLLCVKLLLSSPEGRADIFRGIADVIRESEGLIGFPLESLAEALMEMGQYLGPCPGYEELFTALVEVTSAHKGNAAAARMLLKRGAQQLDADHPVDAVRTIGRAVVKLFTYETQDDIVHALSLCGAAYERLGLLWAARGVTLAAASIATSRYWSDAEVTPLQYACFNRMKWIELQLGRLPHILAWHEVDSLARVALAHQGYDRAALDHGKLDFDGILGILLLRSDLWELKSLSALPDVLDRLSLPCAAVTLQYALGYEEELRAEFLPPDADENALHDFFLRLRDQPAGNDLPAGPTLCDGRTVVFNSIVLGCRVTVESDNELPCMSLGESILAGLESLLSTGMADRIGAREPSVSIRVRKSDFCDTPFEFSSDDHDGRPHVEIRCSDFDPNVMSREMQTEIKSRLSDLLATVMGRAFISRNIEETLTRLFRDDRALERAINFGSSFVTLGNVLGSSPRTDITLWADSSVRQYPLLRSRQWDADAATTIADGRSAKSEVSDARKEHTIEAINAGRLRHSDIEMISLIRESLWEDAKWKGTVFGCWIEDNVAIPVLAPWFENAQAARKIFSFWQEEIGANDTKDLLRVTIVRGISQKNVNAYRVMVGMNPAAIIGAASSRLAVISFRMLAMEPSSNDNLNNFLTGYEIVGRYLLGHSLVVSGSSNPELILDNAISKQQLHVREAWEIGRNDLDSSGVLPTDDPVIPPDHQDAPVLELLRWKRESR